MSRYRKLPVEIDAMQWNGTVDDAYELFEMADCDFQLNDDGTVNIHTLEGVMQANHGDWIIKGVKGECYPCKPDIFAATYEKAD